MLRSRFDCEICHLEIASVGCICCRDLVFIGSGCLTQHIKQCKMMHYVISLSLASDLISHEANLDKYLLATGPYSSNLHSSNLNTQNSQQDHIIQNPSRSNLKTSFSSRDRNIDIDSLSSKISNIDLNPLSSILYSKTPEDKISTLTKKDSDESNLCNSLQNMQNGFILDLKKPLSIDLSSITSRNSRYLFYTDDYGRVFVFDTLSKKVLNMKLPYHESEIYDVRARRDIIFIKPRRVKNISLTFNIRTRRYYLLNDYYNTSDWIMHRNNEEYLYMLQKPTSYDPLQFISYPRRFMRYSFLKNITENLPSFKHINEVHSLAGYGNKIYLFYRKEPCFIEVLNTNTLQFHKIENKLPYHDGFRSKVLCLNNKIYQFYKDYITVYDPSFNKLKHVPSSLWGSLVSIYNYAVSGDQFYYQANSVLACSSLAEHTPSISNHYSPTNITKGRYLYLNRRGRAQKIDLELKSYTSCLRTNHGSRIYSVCEYENDKVIVLLYDKLVICDHEAREEYIIFPVDQSTDKYLGVIYHMNNTYVFSEFGVFRLNMNTMASRIIYEYIDFDRRYPCLVGVGDKIYIIGGGNQYIDMYDTYTDKFYKGVYQLDYEDAVAKLVDDRIIIISRNTYRIFDQDLNEIERGISNCDDYDVIPYSNISLYQGKIYFYNTVSDCIEYYDVETHKRGAEARRYDSPVQYVHLEDSINTGDIGRSYLTFQEEEIEEGSDEEIEEDSDEEIEEDSDEEIEEGSDEEIEEGSDEEI